MKTVLNITITNDVGVMDSRELAILCGQTHFNCMKRIRNILSKEQVVKMEYTCRNNDLDGNYVSTTKYYQLPEREACLLAMSYSYELQAKVYDAWQDSIKSKLPQTFSQALLLAGKQAEQLELQAPKVAFVERFIESTGNKTFREVAKMLKANEREFRAFLLKSKVMYRLAGSWSAHAIHIDAGRFYVTGGESNGHAYTECKFTPKGIEYIAGKWIIYKGVK